AVNQGAVRFDDHHDVFVVWNDTPHGRADTDASTIVEELVFGFFTREFPGEVALSSLLVKAVRIVGVKVHRIGLPVVYLGYGCIRLPYPIGSCRHLDAERTVVAGGRID